MLIKFPEKYNIILNFSKNTEICNIILYLLSGLSQEKEKQNFCEKGT